MPPLGWLVSSLLVAAALVATWRQRDAWPFSHYPMFSRRITVENLVVCRIAIEEEDGGMTWWRPRFFRLPDRLCAEFEELSHGSSGAPAHSPALLALLARTQLLIRADGPTLSGGMAVLFIRRRIVRLDGVLTTQDEVAARVPFLKGPSHGPLWVRLR